MPPPLRYGRPDSAGVTSYQQQPYTNPTRHLNPAEAAIKARPGSTYNSGRLDGVLVELEGDNVHRVRLTSG